MEQCMKKQICEGKERNFWWDNWFEEGMLCCKFYGPLPKNKEKLSFKEAKNSIDNNNSSHIYKPHKGAYG